MEQTSQPLVFVVEYIVPLDLELLRIGLAVALAQAPRRLAAVVLVGPSLVAWGLVEALVELGLAALVLTALVASALTELVAQAASWATAEGPFA